MNLEQLCKNIELPEEITLRVREFHRQCDWAKYDPMISLLGRKESWNEGLDRLRVSLDPDADGVGMLTCMLRAAVTCYEEYLNRGMDEAVYTATMKCFSRFVGEHMVSYGRYGFDRAFWTPRQVSLKLFRLGELEYELWKWKGEKVVSVHIPSDAKMKPELLDASFEMAAGFMEKFFPDYMGAKYVCDSWLLSPALKKLLPEESNIIRFQNRFEIQSVDPDAPDVIEWVFQNAKCDLKDLPERTTLQKNMKAAMLRGEKIGIAFGVIAGPVKG